MSVPPPDPMRAIEVDGWYPPSQLERLIGTVRLVLGEGSPQGAFVELGSWKGRSTVAIANAIYPHELVAVDSFEGNVDEQSTTGRPHASVELAAAEPIYEIFIENMQRHTAGNVRAVVGDVADFLREASDPIRFCHVDASHDYPHVSRSLELLLPRVPSGGVICGDDIATAHAGRSDLLGGVERAVRENLPGYEQDDNFYWWVKQ